jgi:hypothetical protein
MQKFYHTKEDYLGDLKKHSLEPYKQIEEPKSKPYELSPDSRQMIRQAGEYDRRKEKPGSRFVTALNSLGVSSKPKWISDAESLVGGFKNEQEEER